ncbi:MULTISPECIES: GNAT family N-acetyltransferase [Rhizobium/Agrobacterium group]|nr:MULTISPECIES: GNAT family protein [Rhizobium/Agrobacterium group]MCF1449121.1 GNAT family N-acetyltransferase [Allorhizobium ampelinum]MCF1494935.1 GNAT family N-acetyltransferase [Allorhizobium ampelinum]MUO28339.1 GNAT family N-acetyltransferase [Agrobacterium vitis]MUO41221.1 GNAT family N-acetyltransferase [Agrobacterium vitis]MUP08825.1 GNAT family N-acetyltransferase [Agrobacterium vitis]
MSHPEKSEGGAMPALHALAIRPATPNDIDFVMRVERLPGYPERVGTYSVQEHESRMADENYEYLIGICGEKPVGFAVLRPDDGMGNVVIRRLAVEQSGRGMGSVFVQRICAAVFSDPTIGRLILDVLPSNTIARRVYTKLGFVEEGLMRSALRYPDGRRADLLLMALLRDDWLSGASMLVR